MREVGGGETVGRREVKRNEEMGSGENPKESKGNIRKRGMRRGGGGGGDLKRNEEMGIGENLKERKGRISKRGMRRGGGGGDLKRNAEMKCRRIRRKVRGMLGKEE
jgi:hypothetical protein